MRWGRLVFAIGLVSGIACSSSSDGNEDAGTSTPEGGADATPSLDATVDPNDGAIEDAGTPVDANDDAEVATVDAGIPFGADAVVVNDVASCAIGGYDGIQKAFTFCWGADAPSTPQILGVATAPANGFAQPEAPSDAGAPAPTELFEMWGAGSWFLGWPGTYGWGANDVQQAGTPAATLQTPTALDFTGQPSNIFLAAAAFDHGCAIENPSSDLSCWGNNHDCVVTPTAGGGCTGTKGPTSLASTFNDGRIWGSIAAGDDHVCGIYTTAAQGPGTLTCWGNNTLLQTGQGPASAYNLVPNLAAPSGISIPFVARLWAGKNHTCFPILGQPQLTCFGDNRAGQSTGTPSADPVAPTLITTPISIDGIAVGGDTTCFWGNILPGMLNTAYCFGAGPLGRADTTGIQPIAGLQGVSSMAVGKDHACAIAYDAAQKPAVYCWGSNAHHQIDPSAEETQTFTLPHAVTLPSSFLAK